MFKKNLPILQWDNPTAIVQIREYLEKGLIVAGTSDTVIGFLARLTEKGFSGLNAIKERNEKPYVVLIADKTRISYFAKMPVNSLVQRLVDACWPGPLTLVIRTHEELPSFIAPNQTIALRVPKHEGLLQLLSYFPGLFSTSANKSGMPIPIALENIDSDIQCHIACMIKNAHCTTPCNSVLATISNPDCYNCNASCENQVPSTIIDCTTEQPRVIREGAVAISELEVILDQQL